MYQIRKNQKITSIYSTEVAELNPDSFRTLSIPFLGSTEEEFLYYIDKNRSELEELSDELDPATLSELTKLWDPNWVETYNSALDGEESWFESGESVNENHFSINHTTEY